MVTVVTGLGLGLQNSSLYQSGQIGLSGKQAYGRGRQSVYVNAANGNLVLQRNDELLRSAGLDIPVLRTYNSQAGSSDTAWRLGMSRQVSGLTGKLNSKGSQVYRTGEDGHQVCYEYDSARQAYVARDGQGANDTLLFDEKQKQWLWTDGATGLKESYDASRDGRLISVTDPDGKSRIVVYDAKGRISRISSSGGEALWVDYDSRSNITQLRTTWQQDGKQQTQTRTRYSYDTLNRLTDVIIDLTPEDNSVDDGKVYTIRYGYDGDSSRINRLEQSDGSELNIGYVLVNGQYRVSQIQERVSSDNAYGGYRTTLFEYDADKGKTYIQTDKERQSGCYTVLQYDSRGQLTTVSYGAGLSTASSDSVIRQLKVAKKVNEQPQLNVTYYSDGRIATQKDAAGYVTRYGYDKVGNCVSEVKTGAGERYERVRTYNKQNRLLSETRRSHEEKRDYTTYSIYDTTGTRHRFSLSATGQVTEWRYDSAGRVISKLHYIGALYKGNRSSLNESELMAWAAKQNMQQLQRTDTHYDLRGLVSETVQYATTDAKGNGIADSATVRHYFVYDQNGNLLQQRDSQGNTCLYRYDGLNRLTQSTDALGNTVTTTYLDDQQEIRIVSANGLVTLEQYTFSGELIAQIKTHPGAYQSASHSYKNSPMETIRRYEYDVAGHRSVESEGGVYRETRFSGRNADIEEENAEQPDQGELLRHYSLYDERGRLRATIDREGYLVEYFYNQASQLTATRRYATRVAADKITPFIEYSSLSELRPSNSSQDRLTYSFYNGQGQISRTVDGEGSIVDYRYNALGQPIEVIHYSAMLTAKQLASLHQKAPHQVKATDITVSKSVTVDRVEHYLYNAAGLLVGEINAEGYLTEHRYDGRGIRIETLRYANVLPERIARDAAHLNELIKAVDDDQVLKTRYYYDGRGLLVGTRFADGRLIEQVYNSVGQQIRTIEYSQQVTEGETLVQIRPDNDRQQRVVDYEYDANGQLTREYHATQGKEILYGYNNQGLMTRRVERIGTIERQQLQRYDSEGRLIAELNSEGAAALAALGQYAQEEEINDVWDRWGIEHYYNELGQRIRTVYGRRKHLFSYHRSGLIKEQVSDKGVVTRHDYNAFGEVISSTGFNVRVTGEDKAHFFYQGNATVKESVLHTREYNNRGQLLRQYDAEGRVQEKFAYNAFGNLLNQYRAGVTTRFSYNRLGQETTRLTDPSGLNYQETHQYDAFGRIIRYTDAKGIVQQYQYDKAGRQLVTEHSGRVIERFSYDVFGRVLEQTNALGQITRSQYDDKTGIHKVTYPGGITTETQRNGFGELIRVTDGEGHSTRYHYNLDGQLLSVTHPDGTQQRNYYDKSGWKYQTTDGNGVVTVYNFNIDNGKLVTVVDPQGLNLSTVSYYDARGRIYQIVNPDGSFTRTEYDLHGNVIAVEKNAFWFEDDPNRGLIRKEYDAQGNEVVAEIIDHSTFFHLYSSHNLNFWDTGSGRKGVKQRTEYHYDASGHRVRMVEGAGSSSSRVTEYRYDVLGRRTEETVDPDGLKLKTVYRYDEKGNVIARTDALGQLTRYWYNDDGNLLYSVTPMGALSYHQYDGLGRLIERVEFKTTLGRLEPDQTKAQQKIAQFIKGQVRSRAASRVWRTAYTVAGQQEYTIEPSGAATSYRYNKNGQVISETRHASTANKASLWVNGKLELTRLASDADQVTRTFYNSMGRVSHSVDSMGKVTAYQYDAVGNLISTKEYATALKSNYVSSPNAVDSSWATREGVKTVTAKEAGFTQGGSAILISDRDTYATQIIGLKKLERYNFSMEVRQGITPAGHTTGAISIGISYINRKGERQWRRAADSKLNAETQQLQGNILIPNDATEIQVWLKIDGEKGKTSQWYARDLRVWSDNIPFSSSDATQLDETGLTTMLSSSSGDRVTRMSYDNAGRLVQSVDAQGMVSSFTYDAVGQIIETRRHALSEQQMRKLNAQAVDAPLTVVFDSTDQIIVSEYDSAGRKVKETDAMGNVTTTEYDALGRAVKITDPLGHSGYFFYDANNQQIAHINPEGYLIESRYDGLGQLVQTIVYSQKLPSDKMNAGSTLAELRAAMGTSEKAITTLEHDAAGRLIKITDACGYTESMTYDTFGNKISYTNKMGAVYHYRFNNAGWVIEEISPLTAKDAKGKEVAVRTLYRYDLFGNVIETKEAAGLAEQQITSYRYDKANRKVRQVSQKRVVRNDLGLERTIMPTQHWIYDIFGRPIQHRDENGVFSYYWYDVSDRKIAEVNGAGYLSQWEYDGKGNILAERVYGDPIATDNLNVLQPPSPVNNANVREIRYVYDKNSRQIAIHLAKQQVAERDSKTGHYELKAVSPVIHQRYDAVGNLVSRTDARGNTHYFHYDQLGRTIAEVDARGYVTVYEYGEGDKFTRRIQYAQAVKDPLQALKQVKSHQDDRITEYQYDQLGRLTLERQLNLQVSNETGNHRLNSEIHYQYNGLDKITERIDAAGGVSNWTYDIAGREIRHQGAAFNDYNGNSVRPDRETRYNAVGKIVEKRTKGGSDEHITRFEYDAGGNLAKEISANGRETTYQYDAKGQLTRSGYLRKGADGSRVLRNTFYRYNQVGQQIEQRDQDSGLRTETRYNAWGEATGKRTGLTGSGHWQEYSEYDYAGRMIRSNSEGGISKAYFYDASGNATLVIESTDVNLRAVSQQQLITRLAENQQGLKVTVIEYDANNQQIATYQSSEPITIVLAGSPLIVTTENKVSFQSRNYLRITLPYEKVYSKEHQYKVKLPPAVRLLGDGIVRVNLRYTKYESGEEKYVSRDFIFSGDQQEFKLDYYIEENVAESSHAEMTVYKSVNGKEIVIADSTDAEHDEFSRSDWVEREKPFLYEREYSINRHDDTKLTSLNNKLIYSVPHTASALYLQVRPKNSNAGWSEYTVPPLLFDGSQIKGKFAFDYSVLPKGELEFRYQAVDENGKLLDSQQGELDLRKADAATVSQHPVVINGLPDAYMRTDNSVVFNHISEDVTTATLRYRDQHGRWTEAQSLTAEMQGDRLTGFVFSPDKLGLPQGSVVEYELVLSDRDGNSLQTLKGKLTVGQPDSVNRPVVWSDAPHCVQIKNQPIAAIRGEGYYRLKGSSEAFKKVALNQVATGHFVLDAHDIAQSLDSSADYEIEYRLYNAKGEMVNHGKGNITLDKQRLLGVQGVGLYQPDSLKAVQPALLSQIQTGQSNNTQGHTIVRRQTYNAFGEVASETNGVGQTTRYEYNVRGQLVAKYQPEVSVTHEDGRQERITPVSRYGYDINGNLSMSIDANGNIHRQSWLAGSEKGQGHLASETLADGAVRHYGYDQFTHQRTRIDGLGRRTDYRYDSVGNVVRIDHAQRADGQRGFDAYEYDEIGQRTAHITTTDGKDRLRSTTQYDSQGRVIETVSAAGRKNSIVYQWDDNIRGVGNEKEGGWRSIQTDPNGRKMIDEVGILGIKTAHTDLGERHYTYRYNYAGQIVEQKSSQGQHIVHDYYSTGDRRSTCDYAFNSRNYYEYDNDGRKTFEAYSIIKEDLQTYYQQAHVSYDELGRISEIKDLKFTTRYQYDAVGNRRHIWASHQEGVNGAVITQDNWYRYDSMNRFVTSQGELKDGKIVRGKQGIDILYNKEGERVSAHNGKDDTQETYQYTEDGYLASVHINGKLAAERENDLAGRTIASRHYDWNQFHIGRGKDSKLKPKVINDTKSTYDADHILVKQITGDQTTELHLMKDGTVTHAVDSAKGTTTTTYYEYEWWDSARQSKITASPYNANAPHWKEGFSNLVYNVNGHLSEAHDMEGKRHFKYITDAEGLVLRRQEWVNNNRLYKVQENYFFDGIQVGENGNDGTNRIDYAESIAKQKQRQEKANNKGDYREGQSVNHADFDQNYEPIAPAHPGHAPSMVTVGSGDTLPMLAERLWGDRSLWHLLADANGLNGQETLVMGTILVVPNKITNIHNNSSTFRIYNPDAAMGDVNPTLPEPAPRKKKRKWWQKLFGILAKVVIVVVAIIATIYTAGAAAVALGAAGAATMAAGTAVGIAGTMSAGVAALSGSLGLLGVAAAAIGGAVGSLASQGTAILLGQQDKISWSGVAMSGLGAAASAAAGAVFQGMAQANNIQGSVNNALIQGASAITGDVLTQGAAMATGLARRFDWRSVAASGASAFISHKIPSIREGFTDKVLRNVASGGVSRLITGQKGNWANVAAEMFGNMLGNSLVEKMVNRERQQMEELLSAKSKQGKANGLLSAPESTSTKVVHPSRSEPLPQPELTVLGKEQSVAAISSDPTLNISSAHDKTALREVLSQLPQTRTEVLPVVSNELHSVAGRTTSFWNNVQIDEELYNVGFSGSGVGSTIGATFEIDQSSWYGKAFDIGLDIGIGVVKSIQHGYAETSGNFARATAYTGGIFVALTAYAALELGFHEQAGSLVKTGRELMKIGNNADNKAEQLKWHYTNNTQQIAGEVYSLFSDIKDIYGSVKNLRKYTRYLHHKHEVNLKVANERSTISGFSGKNHIDLGSKTPGSVLEQQYVKRKVANEISGIRGLYGKNHLDLGSKTPGSVLRQQQLKRFELNSRTTPTPQQLYIHNYTGMALPD